MRTDFDRFLFDGSFSGCQNNVLFLHGLSNCWVGSIMYCNKQLKLDIHTALRDYVIEKLKEGWSPKQIVGRLNYLGGPQMICHETIYAYIYSTTGKKLKLYMGFLQYVSLMKNTAAMNASKKHNGIILSASL